MIKMLIFVSTLKVIIKNSTSKCIDLFKIKIKSINFLNTYSKIIRIALKIIFLYFTISYIWKKNWSFLVNKYENNLCNSRKDTESKLP